MAELNLPRTQELLGRFAFGELFIEILGWNRPASRAQSTHELKDSRYHRRMIAQLSGVAVFEAWSDAGLPDRKSRDAIQRDVARQHHENLVIFLDRPEKPLQSFWTYARRDAGKRVLREHSYFREQPTDLFIGKLQGLLVEISELDQEGRLPIVEVTRRLKAALDVEQTTKRFFRDYEEQHGDFLKLIEGINDERDRRWYASILLNRLMFVWFLQKKGFLAKQNRDYLIEKFKASQARGKDRFFHGFLRRLFFEGFAKPPAERKDAENWLGEIPYLNGGLFLPHRLELDAKGKLRDDLFVPDKAFANLFSLFARYSWHLDDTPGGKADEINPDVLGYIFEKYINQKAFGAYYTRPEITGYLCERTLHALILDRVRQPAIPALNLPAVDYDSVPELLSRMDGPLAVKLVKEVLPNLKLLDPAVGSGAFLVAAMKALINVYAAVLGKADVLNNATLTAWKKQLAGEHKNLGYGLKRQIVTDNLYGVDIMQEACEIARLRLFLALVASARSVEELEPLPNIDFNIQPGNSVIGLTHVEGKEFDDKHGRMGDLFKKSYKDLVAEKERTVENYRHAASYSSDLRSLKERIEALAREANGVLNDVLLGQMARAGVRFEQAAWDLDKNREGKSVKRALTTADLTDLRPFHWGYEFHDILARGGFDAVITNPPWEAVKPQDKEFLQDWDEGVTKKKMPIEELEALKGKLLRKAEVRRAYEQYLSSFPHQSAWFRESPQFPHQTARVGGKQTGSDINLYKLFTEQCWNLLRPGGRCGIVIPSGIYTDLGARGLRDLLFDHTRVDGLFCFENRRMIFEGVDSRFKFVVLTFEKLAPPPPAGGGGGEGKPPAHGLDLRRPGTQCFPAAFMRHDVAELARFPDQGGIEISVELVKRLSPDSHSVMEFKSPRDVEIAEKLLRHPLLGEHIEKAWKLKLGAEFHMTNDSRLFKTGAGRNRLPLYEGKMIWQFDAGYAEPRYWVEEKEGRAAVLGRKSDDGRQLDYQTYRFVHRSVASNTNERTFIATVVPANVFCGHSLNTAQYLGAPIALYLTAITNSFLFDFSLRQKVTTNLTMFYVYQTPVPRLTEKDPRFLLIVSRAARLICTTPEFDDLAKSVGLKSHRDGATEPAERARLRAELDGLIAHLYELTEDEFAHILGTFPLVEAGVKQAALAAYREFAPKTADQQAAALIAAGESLGVEFKSTARWNLNTKQADKTMEQIVVKTVAALLNSEGGDLLLGVDDSGAIRGLADDYKTLGKKQDRDGFENWLTTQLLDAFGKHIAPCIRITFPQAAGVEICRVAVTAAPAPCYLKDGNAEHLYIRAGNSTRQLSTREAVEYTRRRWP